MDKKQQSENKMELFLRQTSSFHFTQCMSLKWKWTCLYLFSPALNLLQCSEMTACTNVDSKSCSRALRKSLSLIALLTEKQAVQQRTFTKWINMHLKRVRIVLLLNASLLIMRN